MSFKESDHPRSSDGKFEKGSGVSKKIEYSHPVVPSNVKPLKPEKLYHVTHKKNIDKIMKEGLIPQVGKVTKAGHGSSAEDLVFLSTTPVTGLGIPKKDMVIIEIDPDKYGIHYSDGESVYETGAQPTQWGDDEDIPVGVEGGDYFSYETILPEKVYMPYGKEKNANSLYKDQLDKGDKNYGS